MIYPSSVLVVAAHPDDEVLGCGGTMAKLASEGVQVHVLLLADGETSRSSPSASFDQQIVNRGRAAHGAAEILGCTSVEVHHFPDNKMDTIALLDVVKIIELRLQDTRAQSVFTHHAGDVNIDHRVVHEASLAACRPQPGCVVENLNFFEVPSSTEWRPPQSALPFQPNLFFDISRTLSRKIEALEVYADEMRDFPHSRSFESVEALARWRGATVGLESAEAFSIGRSIVRMA